MNENIKINKKCIKGNTTYFKIKINNMIKYEINKLEVNEALYQNLNYKISDSFLKFTDNMISGGDFKTNITKLRDDTITECVEIDSNSSSNMSPFFKDYIFDKIYTMGINIKNGVLPDDYEQELEEAKLKIEEDKQKEENREKEELTREEEDRNINEVTVTVEDSDEEKPSDLVDQMFNYFLGSPKATVAKTKEKPKKQKENDKDKVKDQ